MGSGKSYTGKRLAQKLDVPFIDLDDRIEARQGQSISRLFATFGEAAFRQMEQEALHSLAKEENVVVATGGGTPCFFDNVEWMNQHGVTIYLKASPELLYQRLAPETDHRPLLQGKKEAELLHFLKTKLAERSSFYEQASVLVDQDQLDIPVETALHKHLQDIVGH